MTKEISKEKKKKVTKSKVQPADRVPSRELILPDSNYNNSRFEGILAAFFTGFIILIVRMHSYQRPMDQFYWNSGGNQFSDFFSYYKMTAILICTILALLVILYRITTATFHVRKATAAYICMLVYTVFASLSYIFSDYKEFSLYGYNDRFEGTLVLISYMVMLYFIYNFATTERNVKWVIYPVAGASLLLSLLGLTQALDHDFFRTTIGKKMITPSSYWDHIDGLSFTFQNREIYQTVYNINYVSFYLTLLIPLFGLLFLYRQQLKNRLIWGGLCAITIYNLIGSASSGGFLGMGVAVLVAIVLLNKKILSWWKPLLILMALTVLMGSLTYDRWWPELTGAIKGAVGSSSPAQITEIEKTPDVAPGSQRPVIDYIETGKDSLVMSLNGEPLHIRVSLYADGTVEGLTLSDRDNKPIAMLPTEEQATFSIQDDRFFPYATLSYALDGNTYYILVNTPEVQWSFAIREEGIVYMNRLGKPLELTKIEAMGWKDNLGFGSGRGYIWSRTLPMMKDTLILGHGADTYCIYFPHMDYAGKYSANWSINKVVDKPHNMYMGVAIGTGMISLLALLSLYGIYLVQSFRLYFRRDLDSFSSIAGVGIFLGICGFLVAALVNDSTVSVMPMFYGLLGTGMGINAMLKKEKDR